MAIYHLHAKVIQRSKGKNVIAAAAYRRATTLFDECEGKSWDYSNKEDVIHSEFIFPDDAPLWVEELISQYANEPSRMAEILWNKVDAHEKRRDSQLARELEFALPIELTQEQNITLAREFIKDQFILRGMIADWSVHWDEGNPHVHVLLTMRTLTPEGFGKRALEWNNKALLQEWREKWSEYANFHLRLYQHEARIDHRSYKDQGIELIPTVHQGKAVTDMARRGIQTGLMQDADNIRRENLSRISQNPEILLHKIASHTQTLTFTQEQVAHEFGRYVNDRGQFAMSSSSASTAFQDSGLLATLTLEKLKQEDAKEHLKEIINANGILTPHVISQILSAIERYESAFSEEHLSRELMSYTDNAEFFSKALIEIKKSPDLIYLGIGEDGIEKFTTRRMFEVENHIQVLADQLRHRPQTLLSAHTVDITLDGYQKRLGNSLTEEQLTAIHHILQPSSIQCVVGRAGTGKSYSLGAANAVWEASGLKVYGVTLSGIAASNLQKDAGINSRTITSFLHALNEKHIILKKNDVIVMDEAGMTDSVSMQRILQAVQEAQAKVVLVGDHAQLQPVGPGATFRALLERIGFAEIQTVYRQVETWQRQATIDFSSGFIEQGLKAYEDHHCIHFGKDEMDAALSLVSDWQSMRELPSTSMSLKDYLVLAHRNQDVQLLNSLIRQDRIRRHEIAEGYHIENISGGFRLSKGDRIIFLQNDSRLGVKNGSFGEVTDVRFTETGKVIDFTVLMDADKKEITVNPLNYKHFDYGYAATIHKSQGTTVDHSFFYVGGTLWDRHLTYVAMSRHRKTCHLYTSATTYKNVKSLSDSLGRYKLKDSVLDYPLAFAQRRGIKVDGVLTKIQHHIITRLKTLREKLMDKYEQYIHPDSYWDKKVYSVESEKLSTDNVSLPTGFNLLNDEEKAIYYRREQARVVADYVQAKKNVGKAWKHLSKKLTALGLSEMTYEKDAYQLIASTKEYQLFQDTLALRNAKATHILKSPERYEKAIKIHNLSIQNLEKQAQVHERRERVLQYMTHQKNEKIVLRDKLAATIMQDIKGHYALLNSFGVDVAALRKQGLSHVKRKLLTTLTFEEKENFKKVERYQYLNQAIAKFMASQVGQSKEIILKRELVKKIENFTHERDFIAYQILEKPFDYDNALNYFEIGMINPPFNGEINRQNIEKARTRWEKLENYAARYTRYEDVKAYQKAIFVGDTQRRLSLAYKILNDKKKYHGFIVHESASATSLWKLIRQDAKAFDYQQFKNQLTPTIREAFNVVEKYVEAKKAHSMAWREIYESKHSLLGDKEQFNQLSLYTRRYTAERNKLATKLLENPAIYQPGLEYFGLSLDAINTHAYQHQCHDTVEQFITANHYLTKSKIASEIISDPKAFHGILLEKKISWKDIYHIAKSYEKKSLFATLTKDEKKLIRLSGHFLKLHHKVGKAWSIHKEKEDKFTCYHLMAKRDELAYRVLDAKKSWEFNQWFDLGNTTQNIETQTWIEKNMRLRFEKLEGYANRYEKAINAIKAFQDVKENLQYFLHEKMKTESVNGKWINEWRGFKIDVSKILSPILANLPSYHSALRSMGLSENTILKFKAQIENFEKSLFMLRDYEASIQDQRLTIEQQDKIAYANRIYQGTREITGTLAERYLREHRGIQGKLPASFRYHPGVYHFETKQKLPALVVVARNEAKEIQAVQVIFLNAKTAQKASLKNSKLTYGVLSQGPVGVLVNKGMNKTNILAVAEGPETALSIKEAHPDWAIYATLGSSNFARVPLHSSTSKIIFCADNDGEKSHSQQKLLQAAIKLSYQGKEIWQATPPKAKQDFNDVLKQEGVAFVRDILDKPILLQKAQSSEVMQLSVKEAITKMLDIPINNDVAQPSLNELLREFVNDELKLNHLVLEKNTHLGNKAVLQGIHVKVKNVQEKILHLSRQIMEHRDTQAELKELKLIKPATLLQRGGYPAIYERLSKGTLIKEDIHVLIVQIRSKIRSYSHSLKEDKHHGGGRSQ